MRVRDRESNEIEKGKERQDENLWIRDELKSLRQG